VAHKIGEVVSTSAMFLETSSIVEQWASEGFIGVDGETATTFAVAKKFGADAVGLLTCSDNLALGHNFWETSDGAEDAEDQAIDHIRELALSLA
jgi:purine-nucleoside phosphorylase